MKKVIVATLLLFQTAFAGAWEFARNPDRVPSFGLNVSETNLNGTRAEIDQPDTDMSRVFRSPEKSSYYTIGGDVRLPANEVLTFTLSYNQVTSDTWFTRSGNIYKQDSTLSGYNYGLGLRFYFSK